MTILCDRCGKSYLARSADTRPGTILRLLCPHCSTPLWSVLPRTAPHIESSKRPWPEPKSRRGVS